MSTCAGGTGTMAVLTSPPVAVIVGPWVTCQLTPVSLKTEVEKTLKYST